MIRATIEQGQIRPLQPLPPEWVEGMSLEIETSGQPQHNIEEIERNFAILEQLCSTRSPEDELKMEQALQEARMEAKEYMRRKMGLTP